MELLAFSCHKSANRFAKACREIGFVLLFSALSGGGSFGSVVASPRVVWAAEAAPVSAQELASEIQSRLKRVPEFEFIREQAQKLGVRAWLFGGTASGYAHYVNWDLKREKGDVRFQKDRFDYDYTNIFRSTQDLDIVVDGNPEQVAALQKALSDKYPHFQGNKAQWEVRSLRQKIGEKEALLGNPDYLNQHTDSNSTGMVEITAPKEGESAVRDLRDWDSKSPIFLKDVHEGKLHYYFSPSHRSTSRFRQGLNPPILSAIRYLTKAFQYQLEMRPEDLERIQKVIQDFDPTKDLGSDYAMNWIEKNGKKLIQNAVNIEFAVETLDRLGLRKKLKKIRDDVRTIDSLAWWMNKEPLRSKPVGQGSGRTAAEIFKMNDWSKTGEPLVLAHEAKDFFAFESITRAHTGDPNLLISRKDFVGESAFYGDGFYSRVGRIGARGTGFTIRFILDPSARVGTDFTYDGEYVVVRNKAAMRVIPESLDWGPVEYFSYLAKNRALAISELGLFEKMKRRMSSRISSLRPEETKRIAEIVEAAFSKRPRPWSAFAEWFALPLSSEFSQKLVMNLAQNGADDPDILSHLGKYPHWNQSPGFRQALRRQESYDSFVLNRDSDPKKLKSYLQSRFVSQERALTAEDRSLFTFAIRGGELKPVDALPLIQHPQIDEGTLMNLLHYGGPAEKAVLAAVAARIGSKDFSLSQEMVMTLFDGMAGQTIDEDILRQLMPILSGPRFKNWTAVHELLLERIESTSVFQEFLTKVLKGSVDSIDLFDEIMSKADALYRSGDGDPHRLLIPFFEAPQARKWKVNQLWFLETVRDENLLREFFEKVVTKAPHTSAVRTLNLRAFKGNDPKSWQWFHEPMISLLAAQPHTPEWTSVKQSYITMHGFNPKNLDRFIEKILSDPNAPRVLFRAAEKQLPGGRFTLERIVASDSIRKARLEALEKSGASTSKKCFTSVYYRLTSLIR